MRRIIKAERERESEIEEDTSIKNFGQTLEQLIDKYLQGKKKKQKHKQNTGVGKTITDGHSENNFTSD